MYVSELKNYRNLVIVQEYLILTNEWYQKAEDYLISSQDPKKHLKIKLADFKSLSYNTAGHTLLITYASEKQNLEFYSNSKLIEVVDQLQPQKFMDMISEKKVGNRAWVFTIPVAVVGIIVTWSSFTNDIYGYFKGVLFLFGFLIAGISIFKKMMNGKEITYQKK